MADSPRQEDNTVTRDDVTSHAALNAAFSETADTSISDYLFERLTGQPATHWGTPGEQAMGFRLAELGYELLTGPSGKAGKQPNEPGADVLAVSREDGTTLLGDNKALGIRYQDGQPALPVATASTALVDNLPATVSKEIEHLKALSPSEARDHSLARLEQLKDVLDQGGGVMPGGLDLAIVGAGGLTDGISDKLQEKFFSSYHLTDADGRPARIRFIDGVGPGQRQQILQQAIQADAQAQRPSRRNTVPQVLELQPRALDDDALQPEPGVFSAEAVSGAAEALSGEAAAPAAKQGAVLWAWNQGLGLIKTAVGLVRGADQQQKDLQRALEQASQTLRGDPSAGVLIGTDTLNSDRLDLFGMLAAYDERGGPEYLAVHSYGPSAHPLDAYAQYLETYQQGQLTRQGYHVETTFMWVDQKGVGIWRPPEPPPAP
jgi:hypothetical protein